ncbi:MAG: S41 family peptidase, partial [Myxococcales bacterium]|nr:S41 family peptidase [Myxococcales bacterium]
THVACFVAGAAVATAVGAAALPARGGDADVERFRTLDSFAQALHYVRTEYVDTVDERKLLYAAAKGMMSSLDKHSAFLPPRRYERMRQDTEGAFGGVGLTFGPGGPDDAMPEASPWPIVDEVVAGSPADRAGIQLDDRIVTVDGHPTVVPGEELLEVGVWENRTRGPSGTRVELGVLRPGWDTPHALSLVREQVKMPSVESVVVEPRIGYVAIHRFQEATHDDALAALQALDKAGALDVLILDLRGNPGGLLDQGIRVADLFLDQGLIVSINGRQGSVEKFTAHATGTYTKVKIAVLVDAQTASASEILSGALQDHQRATIFGLQTYGKGSVQTFFDLEDGSGLKMTTARYFTPSGRSLEGTGITPDVSVDTFEAEVLVPGAGSGAEDDSGAAGSGTGAAIDASGASGAGASAGNDARILEELAEDYQFQVALQTGRGWLGSK